MICLFILFELPHLILLVVTFPRFMPVAFPVPSTQPGEAGSGKALAFPRSCQEVS